MPVKSAIVGCVKGSAGGVLQKDGWHVVFFLQPFRVTGGEVVKKEVRVVTGRVEQRALTRWMSKLKAGELVTCQVERLAKPKGVPWWSAAGVLPVKKARADETLTSTRARSDEKVVVKDRMLGKLTLDSEYGCWSGRRKYRGRSYVLELDRSQGGDERTRNARDIERARAAVRCVEKAMPAIRDAIIAKMLPLYNGRWSDEAAEIGPRTFMARVAITSLTIDPRGSARVLFSAGDMFTDHAIEACVTPAAKIRSVQLA